MMPRLHQAPAVDAVGRCRRSVLLGAWCAMIGSSGCVGPNFHRPTAPPVDRYTVQPLAPETSAVPATGAAHGTQRFLSGDVPKNWWTLFGSHELDALVQEALRANPDVASAQAALRQARELTAAQRGAYFPGASAQFGASRNRDATGVLQPTLNSGSPLYSLYTPQVTVSYVPDIFGANRRAVESLEAQAESARFQLDATYLTLTANVVTTVVQEAGLRAQIDGTVKAIALEKDSLHVLNRELELGAIAEVDVYAQVAVLAALEATLPPLNKQLHQAEDQLAIYLGKVPAQFTAPALTLEQLVLPADLPLGVPSELIERRPDVRAAEAMLHSATAQVGVAIANMLPQLTITGDLGSTATLFGDLFRAGTGFWNLNADATQTLFAGGALWHRKRAADAALEEAAAQYRSAVLTAFQNVADALHALEADADALDAATRGEDAARNSFDIARRQLELGSVSYLALINAEQAYQQAVVTLAQARSLRYADTAALFQALGGSISPPPLSENRP